MNITLIIIAIIAVILLFSIMVMDAMAAIDLKKHSECKDDDHAKTAYKTAEIGAIVTGIAVVVFAVLIVLEILGVVILFA